MKRLLLMSLLAVVVAAGLIWWKRTTLIELARQELERQLTLALGDTTTVKSLHLSVWPVWARAEDVVVGEDGAFARLDRLEIRMAALSTVAEARPVAKIAAKGLYVDLTRRPNVQSGDGLPMVIPGFRLGGVRIAGLRVRFRMGDEIGFLSVAQVRGLVDSSVLRKLISGDLAFSQCVLSRASQTLDLGDIRIAAYQDSQGLTIGSGSLDGPGRSLRIAGSGPTLHELDAELDLHDLVIIDDDFDPFRGPGSVSGEIVGALDSPILQGSIKIGDTRIAGRRVGMLTTKVHHEGDTTSFQNARLQGDSGEVRGNVTAKFRREIPVEGTLTWDVSALESLLNKVDVAFGFDNQVRATTIVKGQFDPLDLQVSADGAILAGVEVARAQVKSRIGRQHADFEFALSQPSGSRITGQLKVRDGALEGAAEVEAADLAALTTIAPRSVDALDLSGSGRAAVLIRGTSAEPRLEGTINAGPISVTDVPLDDVQGSFAWTEAMLEVPSATLRTRGGTAVLSGKVALEEGVANAWRLNLTKVDTDLATRIAQRFAGFSEVVQGGTLTGFVELSGAWSNPELTASLIADATRVAGEEFIRIAVDGEKRASRWNLDLDAVHASDLRLHVVGGASGGTAARVEVTTTPGDLRELELAKRAGLSGVIALKGELAGDPAMPDGEFRLSGSNFSIGNEEIGQVELRATGTRGNWHLEGEAPEKRLSITGTASAKAPFRYNARIDWQELAFDYRANESDHLRGATTGVVNLEGELAAINNSRTSLRVTDLHLQWDDALIELETPIVGDGRLQQIQIAPFSLVGKETNLEVAGSLASNLDLAMTLHGRISLDYLELLGEPFVSTNGNVILDMKVGHSAGDGWGAHGTASLERSVLDFGLPAAFSDATGTIVMRGRVAELQGFTAKSGGGEVRLSGFLDRDAGPKLKWHLSDVTLNLDADLEATIEGDGTLEGRWRELMLRGAIDVKNALYSRDFEVVDIPALFKPRIEAVAERPPAVVHFDLKADGRGGLYIDNNVAQVEISLDGKLKGTPQEPQFVGTLSVLNGKVKVRRRHFTLTAGAADFRGEFPPNPNVNINAETEISTREADYIITATVTGTARDPIVHFSSDDPSLTQNDLITLVAVGRTAAELQGESGGVTSIDALALVPTAPVEEQVSALVGIDRFEIDLAQTNSQGDISPGLTIGKNLTDRLRGAVTTTFDTEARNAVVIEYDLTRRISLLGQWEADTEAEAGAFGGGLRVRYEFRRIPLSILGRRPTPRQPDAN